MPGYSGRKARTLRTIRAPRRVPGMARKKLLKKLPPGENLDLFDQVRVTWSEVEAWTRATAGIGRDSWRFDWYVRGWNVPDKIRAAKLAGKWPLSIMAPPGTGQKKPRP